MPRACVISDYKRQILDAVENNQVVIVTADTGSGKSTQIPQYLLDAGYDRIVCTQPRRLAARKLGQWVSHQRRQQVGGEIGYQTRMESCMCNNTKVKFVTDGIFLQECLQPGGLGAYSVIMLDEVHERSLNSALILALVKRALAHHESLKVIVTSATMDVDKFAKFFSPPAFTIELPGKKPHKIEIFYQCTDTAPENEAFEVAEVIANIHENEEGGDILAFLSGKDEIQEAAKLLGNWLDCNELNIVKLHRGQLIRKQDRAFSTQSSVRKVILATNIAETSLTIDGIKYVVDGGYCKEVYYTHGKRASHIRKMRIAQPQAIQRTGRAGRTQPGKCYRLYSKKVFDVLDKASRIEIDRVDLSHAVLMLKSVGIKNVEKLDFVDKPNKYAVGFAEDVLIELGALDLKANITDTGRQMLKLKVEPRLALMVLSSLSPDLHCSEEICKIVAMMHSDPHSLFINHRAVKAAATRSHKEFFQPEGDLVTLMKVYDQWLLNRSHPRWCKERFLNPQALLEANQSQVELVRTIKSMGHELKSCGDEISLVQQAICEGYFMNSANRLSSSGKGRKLVYERATNSSEEDKTVTISPDSSLFKKHKQPPCLVYQLVWVWKSGAAEMRNVTEVDASWLRLDSRPKPRLRQKYVVGHG